jgi:hypothetical protein
MKKMKPPEGYKEVSIFDMMDQGSCDLLALPYNEESLEILNKICEVEDDTHLQAICTCDPTFTHKRLIIELRNKYNPTWKTMNMNISGNSK